MTARISMRSTRDSIAGPIAMTGRARWRHALVWTVLSLVGLGGCLSSPYRECKDGNLCPLDKICHPVTSACVNTSGCGNGIVEAGEECDGEAGELPVSRSCVTFGYDLGQLRCSECTWTGVSECRRFSGFHLESTGLGAYEGTDPDAGAQTESGQVITAIWGRDRDDIFMTTFGGGSGGTVACYDGQHRKTLYRDSETRALNGLAGNATEVVAVGAKGLILRFEGPCAEFSESVDVIQEESGVTESLNAVWLGADGEAIAVGDDGIVVHRASSAWEKEDSGSPENLLSVGRLGAGLYAADVQGNLYERKDGGDWSLFTLNNPADDRGTLPWRGIWTDEASGARFLVGDQGSIWCSQDGNGDNWVTLDSNTKATLRAIWSRDGDVYVAGEGGTVLYYRASGGTACDRTQSWTQMWTPIAVTLRGIWGSGPDNVYAVGGNTDSVVLRHDGTRLDPRTLETQNKLFGLWRDHEVNGGLIAVGEGGEIRTINPMTNDGGESTSLSPTETFNDVWGRGPNDVFAVGTQGTIAHYDGAAWSPLDDADAPICAAGAYWNAVRGTADELFVVGAGAEGESGRRRGVIAHRRADGTWDCIESIDGAPIESELRDVWVSDHGQNADAGVAHAVGNEGLILRHDRATATWSRVETGLSAPTDRRKQLNGVWQSAGGEVFIVGEGGLVLRRESGTGGEWLEMRSGTTETLLAVRGSSASDVFAVGTRATLLHYDGHRWTPISVRSSGVFEDLRAIVADSAVEIWLLGTTSLLRLVRPDISDPSPTTTRHFE
jgi:hypothetical protein